MLIEVRRRLAGIGNIGMSWRLSPTLEFGSSPHTILEEDESGEQFFVGQLEWLTAQLFLSRYRLGEPWLYNVKAEFAERVLGLVGTLNDVADSFECTQFRYDFEQDLQICYHQFEYARL